MAIRFEPKPTDDKTVTPKKAEPKKPAVEEEPAGASSGPAELPFGKPLKAKGKPRR